ncbi:hypothetical protein ACHAWF_015423 [Thalassiosira exigua]
MTVSDEKRGHKRRMGKRKGARPKAKASFVPNSPTSVGSPVDDGSRFNPRPVRQRTPKKLCTLALPPPLISLFDASGAASTSTARPGGVGSSDLSLDGHSVVDSAAPHAPTPARHSSAASVVSASVASVGGVGSGGSSIHQNPHLPLHLRVGMAPCDPLLVFEGKFVLVGTCDGRVAVYSIVEFDQGGISEDVEASERRRRAEWKEEDEKIHKAKGEEKKDEHNTQPPNRNSLVGSSEPSSDALEKRAEECDGGDDEGVQEEESEWDMIERMQRREKARQMVEPFLILTLPDDDRVSECIAQNDEENRANPGNVINPPTIVAMCATPGSGTSMVERRDTMASPASTIADGQSKALVKSSSPIVPIFGKDLLGHVAVLTDDGVVHVLELLQAPASSNDSQRSAGPASADRSGPEAGPVVNVITSFRTGHLGATCICMDPVVDKSINAESYTEGSMNACPIRLCIGHQSGIIASFQVHSSLNSHGVRVGRPTTNEHTAPENSLRAGDNRIESTEGTDLQTQFISKPQLITRSKSTDFRGTSPSKIETSDGKGASHVIASTAISFDQINFQRTLSEPISASDIDLNELAPVVGPAKVELCWKGMFGVPICSISSPGWAVPAKEETQVEASMLVVGLEHRQSDHANQNSMTSMSASLPNRSLSPAISLEMVNATLAERLWHQNSPEKVVQLQDCSVWPAAGKEIKDGWLRGAQPRVGVDPREELLGSLGVQRTSTTKRICCFEGPEPCFVSAASDGTICISHYLSEDGSWGIVEENNQIKLFSASIGIGTIDFGSGVSGARRYAASCLRGGTIYLTPVREIGAAATTEANCQNEIYMFCAPEPDGDDDALIRFVQNFAAGMAQMTHWKDSLSTNKSTSSDKASHGPMKAVAMVGWQGGTIDVYEVTPDEIGRQNGIVIRELIDGGVATKLVLRLLEIDSNHPLLSSKSWRSAWIECREGKNLDTILSGIGDTGDFAATRSILLSLT